MVFRIKSSDLAARPNLKEAMTLRASLVRLALGIGGYVLLVWLLTHWFGAGHGYLIAVILSVTVIPVVVPAFLGFWAAWYRFSSDRALERWQGNYYSFDNEQVRIIEYKGGVWIVMADALKHSKMTVLDDELILLGPGNVAELEEFHDARAISDTGLLTLLARRNYREANRFRLWLERDVLPPLYRRRTGQTVPYTMGAARAPDPPPGTPGA